MSTSILGPTQSVRMLGAFKGSWCSRTGKSTTCKILSLMYPDRIITMHEVDMSDKYVAFTRLRRDNSVEAIATPDGDRYGLTLWGRCRVLCIRLKIPFLGLCILSDAYTTHRRQIQDGLRTSYVTTEIMRSFDMLYDKKSIRNMIAILQSHLLASHQSQHVIRLEDRAMEMLCEHEATLDDLHRWVMGIPLLVTELSLTDPDMLRRIRGW